MRPGEPELNLKEPVEPDLTLEPDWTLEEPVEPDLGKI